MNFTPRIIAALLVIIAGLTAGLASSIAPAGATSREEIGRLTKSLRTHEARGTGRSAQAGITALELALAHLDNADLDEAKNNLVKGMSILRSNQAPDVVRLMIRSLNDIGDTYRSKGLYREAEPLFTAAIDLSERSHVVPPADYAGILSNFAWLYIEDDKYDLAQALLRRAVGLARQSGDPDILVLMLNNSAVLDLRMGLDGNAEAQLKEALALVEKDPDANAERLVNIHTHLAKIAHGQRRLDEAGNSYQQAVKFAEKVGDPAMLATALGNLSELRDHQGNYAGADAINRRALELIERAGLFYHKDLRALLDGRVFYNLHFNRTAEAAESSRRLRDLVLGQAAQGIDQTRRQADAGRWQFLRQSRKLLAYVPRALWRLRGEQGARANELAEEAFTAAQWAIQNEAGNALNLMSARVATAGGSNVRERDRLLQRRGELDSSIARILTIAPGQRAEGILATWRAELERVEQQLKGLDGAIATASPSYQELSLGAAVTVKELQTTLLRANEVLVVVLDTPELKGLPDESFVWAISRSQVRWTRLSIGTQTLRRMVASIRCGLDHAAWKAIREPGCHQLLEIREVDSPASNSPLPFDLARSHALYKEIFGGIEDIIDGKELQLVLPGPLMQLPFQVLVTAPPPARLLASADPRQVEWLGIRQPISVLPSVASLKSLRQTARASTAQRFYLGIGNPLLDGRNLIPGNAEMRALAASWQTCAATDLKGACLAAFPRLTTSAGQVAARIREWSPLPQTACELCAIAQRTAGADMARDIRLGAAANKRDILGLGAVAPGANRSALQSYRVIHFATHATVADTSAGFNEPGLVLTPGKEAGGIRDDGYLTASEVAELNLDADWVILSACNTAAGSPRDGEAFSGLARAFFYAGARGLLVSNWEVYTNAAVDLTTRMFRELETNPGTGRAIAMRNALAGMIADAEGDRFKLHPAYWAAFSIVGEGGPIGQQRTGTP